MEHSRVDTVGHDANALLVYAFEKQSVFRSLCPRKEHVCFPVHGAAHVPNERRMVALKGINLVLKDDEPVTQPLFQARCLIGEVKQAFRSIDEIDAAQRFLETEENAIEANDFADRRLRIAAQGLRQVVVDVFECRQALDRSGRLAEIEATMSARDQAQIEMSADVHHVVGLGPTEKIAPQIGDFPPLHPLRSPSNILCVTLTDS
jgi:hypothetical protein